MNNKTSVNKNHLDWVEWIKAIALIWIFLNHVGERIFGFPWISNPTADWPPLAERIAQLSPLTGDGISGVFINLFRYVSWFGDQGVQLFIIISGFGLTWGLLAQGKNTSLPLKEFYLRRLGRVYPFWWGAHLFFFAAWLFTGRGLAFTEIASWLSFLGLRVTPSLFYHFSPAWWYFVLIIQLYLVYPILWEGLRRLGTNKFLLLSSAVAFAIRAAGLVIFTDYLDVWQRGGIFITRLPEFVFGMALAAWMYTDRQSVERRLSSPLSLVGGVFAYALGLLLSLDLLGMTFGPFLLGVGAFLVLYNLLARILKGMPRWITVIGIWIGVHSYSLYLMHHPVINRLISEGSPVSLSVIVRIGAALVGTVVLALFLEVAVGWVEKVIQRSIRSVGKINTVVRAGLLGIFLLFMLLASEALVRKFSPQEIFGWGERSSLEMDDELGWRLVPGIVQRLRWQSYDYTVTANTLGFPGTEYPAAKGEGIRRVLVTGDAFSSAEGVNTELAWPRLLETNLRGQLGEQVEVMNFAITGYGPNQYAAVVNKFTPIYQPDLVIVELFVNDFDDVMWTNEQFQQSIGFYEPSQTGIYSFVRLEHLRSFFRYDILDPLSEYISSQPQKQGYFLGYFNAFEKSREAELADESAAVSARLKSIRDISRDGSAALLFVLVPSSIQVCQPPDLDYYPRHVDFSDPETFDPELPQNLFFQIGDALDVPVLDLRSAFRDLSECPYQAKNSHWTAYGHEVAADFLADYLVRQNLIGEAP